MKPLKQLVVLTFATDIPWPRRCRSEWLPRPSARAWVRQLYLGACWLGLRVTSKAAWRRPHPMKPYLVEGVSPTGHTSYWG